jgi:hypothetical protein
MRKTLSWAVACAGFVLLALPATALSANTPYNVREDVKLVPKAVSDGTLPIIADALAPKSIRTARLRTFAASTAVVGETRNWLALDDSFGAYYRKGFTLRGVGAHAEVWVASELNRRGASGTEFLAGDCRNPRTSITDAQVNYLINEFDTNIWPKEADAFAIAPDHDGSQALLGAPFNPLGDGSKTVILVDNVRDDNFYDTNGLSGFAYIAGFFSTQLNAYFDRNIMTIDAFDWLHRTGATPPDNPSTDPCTNARAHPFLYEGTFAHEYQHLLEHYSDPDEVTWVNEGLSDWAMSLTGYAHPEIPITQVGFDPHIQTFEGWMPGNGGPENSLTRWSDQGGGEILADYGAAYSFMTYLDDHYGHSFMSALHRSPGNGLVGLQDVLNTLAPPSTASRRHDGNREGHGERGQPLAKVTALDLTNIWAVTMATDGLIDNGADIKDDWNPSTYSSSKLFSTINWDNANAYSSPGAPSNGSDYVRLRGASGAYLSGRDIDSLSFLGSKTLPDKPVAWSVDANPPSHAADPALYSDFGNLRDEAIVKQVTVTSPSLTFDALWNEELGWDFGFVQVSTDGGVTYSSLSCTDTTTTTDPDALPTARQNVPGFTGYSGDWQAEACDVSAYSGQTVQLAFRTYNDPATLGDSDAIAPGFWVDNVKLGTTVVSDGSSLTGWQSPTQVHPSTVSNFTVWILSANNKRITLRQLPLNSDFALKGKTKAEKYVDKKADLVAAIITYNDPAETSDQYAPYVLSVNGVVQPGGN